MPLSDALFPAWGLAFVVFGVVGLVSRKLGRSLIRGAPFDKMPEEAYMIAIILGISWTAAMCLMLWLRSGEGPLLYRG